MRRILIAIPVSAALIAGLVALKLNRRYETPPEDTLSATRLAPLFQLVDEHSRTVRLEAYAGRHKLLIVFFDGSQGAEQSALLSRLRERYADLHGTGAIVLAISEARPSQNRFGAKLEHLKVDPSRPGASEGEAKYPFRVLTDIPRSEGEPNYPVHRLYGAYDEKQNRPLEAVFIVDRGRVIRYAHLGPDGLGTVDEWVAELERVQ